MQNPDPTVVLELEQLAHEAQVVEECSRCLFGRLHKARGTKRFEELLEGVQYLFQNNQPAGKQLREAFLVTATNEKRLVAPLSRFSSARRLHLILQQDESQTNPFGEEWSGRLESLISQVRDLGFEGGSLADGAEAGPGLEPTWVGLRRALADSLDRVRGQESPPQQTLLLIGELVRLEINALEERTSRLAGNIDPLRVSAFQRLLSVLAGLDPLIRDTRQFLASLDEGDLHAIFRQQWSRALDVMELGEYRAFLSEMGRLNSVADLSRLHVEQMDHSELLDEGGDRSLPSKPIGAAGGTSAEKEPENLPKDAKDEQLGASEIKKMVMGSMQTTSVLLSLLKNPKITAVPGLVAEVAVRTRNPQIITTIATDRALHTGFANRDVPLACLRNPSNVSVKTLRKFVHVKFVSKIDLKQMSNDKAGVRRELRQEIDKYLNSLA